MMVSHQSKSVTIIELIIAVTLVGVTVLAINRAISFAHYHIISSERRAKAQNDVSRCLDHITKQGLRTIGNEIVFNSNSAVVVVANVSLAFFIDANGDGKRDTTNDHWIGYVLDASTHELSYYNNCGVSSSPACSVITEVLSKKITAFTPTKDFTLGKNDVTVGISGRWDPAVTVSQDNPEVTMSAKIQLPSVSTN